MLTAYFDDSGTHATSDIVLMGGLVGTDTQWAKLVEDWARHLTAPLDGMKEPLTRFHMTDCFNSRGEFLRWNRTETDYFSHQLRTLIIDSEVSGYAMACDRKAWEEIMVGDLRDVQGDPEGNCVRNVFVKVVAWAQNAPENDVLRFVFDDRPQRERETRFVQETFKQWGKEPPKLGDILFRNSVQEVPLQAADMFAWEMYQHALNLMRNNPPLPSRKELVVVMQTGRFYAQMATRENIVKVRDHTVERLGDNLAVMAEFFRSSPVPD